MYASFSLSRDTERTPARSLADRVPQELRRVNVCCVFICRDRSGRLLLHRRTDACRDEAGTWDCGGGALEFGEDPFEAVRREVEEEYGARVQRLRGLGVRNVLRDQDGRLTHWVALLFDVLVDPDEVTIAEPEKMGALAWFDADALPHPLHSQLTEHLQLLPGRVSLAARASGWMSSWPRQLCQPLVRAGSRIARFDREPRFSRFPSL